MDSADILMNSVFNNVEFKVRGKYDNLIAEVYNSIISVLSLKLTVISAAADM
jgi:hypothetical protein